jgi:teichuronic acid biosynthesis glycosyltransferase TuaC
MMSADSFRSDSTGTPRLLVLSSLFPSDALPGAGIFIRERMFRVARHRPLVVVAPQPWFPGQSLIRRFRPHFRPAAKRHETMQGVEVFRPRFFSVPGALKSLDGVFMALGAFSTVRRLVRERDVNVLDVHFGYPDGHAGRLLARWLSLPMVLTLRGKEARQATTALRRPLASAVRSADRVITVSSALRDVAVELGADPARVQTIGNGIDLAKFRPIPRNDARRALGIPQEARVLVTVGTLVERKGFNRVIEVMPRLLETMPDLHYLVVGGAGAEGDDSQQFRAQVSSLGLEKRVHFVGPVSPEQLHVPLSAANVFVLATRYEGWANVLLEAMACGLPVVATDVGGNPQVVSHAGLGRIVPFGDADALAGALQEALHTDWNRRVIRGHAEANSWEMRIPQVVDVFDRLLAPRTRRSGVGVHRVAPDESQAVQRAFSAVDGQRQHPDEATRVEAHHAR